MVKLIIGRAGCGKTTAVLECLCQAGRERRQVLMVPEQQSHQAERALCKAGGDGVYCTPRCCPSAALPTGCSWPREAWESRNWTAADGCCSCTRR